MALSKKKYSLFFLVVIFSSLFLLFIFPDKEIEGPVPKSIGVINPPAWPLPLLNRDERSARLKFALANFQLDGVNHSGPVEKGDCLDLLKKLKTLDPVNILEPDIVASSREDQNIPDNVLNHCPYIEIDRVWHSWEKGVLTFGVDPVFDALPLGEKDDAADFYHKKTGPIEFYDLSRYFEPEKVWGTFAEAGYIVCNIDNNLCNKLEGYRLLSNLILGPVFDAQSCHSYLHSKVKAGSSMIVDTRHPYAFRELPNFYAYIDLEGDIYRIGLSSLIPLGDMKRLMQNESATLIVEFVSKSQGASCTYAKQ